MSKRPAEGELLKCVIERITFKNDETGFGVVKVKRDLEDKSVQGEMGLQALVGVLPPGLCPGLNIVARGEWQTHPKFGRQFRAWSITETQPTSKEAIIKYLASGVIKGFGLALAERIVNRFGEQALQIIDNHPQRLLEVSGIGEKKLGEIKTAWEEKRNLREVLLFFQTHNIQLGLARRIYNTYQDRSIEIVKKNPYVLARDVWGIGFQTADRIAGQLGITSTSPHRIVAGILYTLRLATEEGNCFLPKHVLLAKTGSLLGIGDEKCIEDCLEQAKAEEGLIEESNGPENHRVYLKNLHVAETQLAEAIRARILPGCQPEKPISPFLVETACEAKFIPGDARNDLASQPKIITLSEEQKKAITLAAEKMFIVITGGPGCGKTTVLRTVARLYRQAGLDVKLAAPTGRAAQRLAEVCEISASTIHRLLKIDPIKRVFLHDEQTPLPLDALIVDECSMIDLPLAASLLRALPQGCRLVLVGDADQLPSVGPGLFLSDLLSVPEVPRVQLTTLFRRKDESLITQVAHDINSAIIPQIPEPDGNTKTDAYFLPAENIIDAANLVERLVVDQIPKKFGLKANDITVLTPMNQGELGVIALNQRIQARLVPLTDDLPRVKVGQLEFRLGDRVCQRVNNYTIHQAGVFNGDQGEIIGIDGEAENITVRLWDGREILYNPDVLDQLDLAYALTIHRAQGSEVPAIVLALHDSHNILLERQLIYTAVTRAKQLLIIVGTKRAIILATKRSRSKRRYTSLPQRIGH